MKKVVLFFGLLIGLAGIYSFTTTESEAAHGPVKWYTWEEAVAANKKNPKKFYVDVYTDWCGWCKVMDKKTFTDHDVAEYLNTNFYPIKLNAEQKEDINFDGQIFAFLEVEGSRRGGVHTLAYSLLEGKMSYPSFVFLNEKYERIMVSPGYKKPAQLLPELKFAADEIYKTTEWAAYAAKNVPKD